MANVAKFPSNKLPKLSALDALINSSAQTGSANGGVSGSGSGQAIDTLDISYNLIGALVLTDTVDTIPNATLS